MASPSAFRWMNAARADVRAAVSRARELRGTLDRPPVTENERLCRRCSLAPVCLPEEVRQDHDPQHAAIRLFPPDDQRTSLYVVSDAATVGRSGDRLVVRPREGPESKHASHEVAAVLLHGSNQITTQAISLCVDRNIAVHWVSGGGRHVASLASSVGQVQRRVRQYQALSDDATRLRLAKQLVRAKVEGQHRYLLRATRGADNLQDRKAIRPDLLAISGSLASIAGAADFDVLRGHEGDAAVHYFAGLRAAVSGDLPESLRYAGRSRRPTLDRFSSILNFGYALLQTAVMRAILAAGLEPALGFYHTPRSAAHPLVLDLMELFRCPLWDLVVIGSLNRGMWDPSADFSVTRAKIWLSDAGRRKAIALFEERLREQWKHPVVNYSLSYARTIELEARLLEKEWTGEPGLFARMRLR
jgi:CRISPR-associated protein Cas1